MDNFRKVQNSIQDRVFTVARWYKMLRICIEISFHDANAEGKLAFLTNTFVRSLFCCHFAFLIIEF